MIREFNYTQRKRIESQHIRITLAQSGEGGTSSFTAEVDLADLQLPADAPVVLEAARASFARRFEWGTVGSITPPPNREISDVGDKPTFRIMVLTPDASRRILALGKVTPKVGQDDSSGSEGLVFLKEEDLGQEVWRLDFGETDDAPVLKVNSSIEGISQAARYDPAFRSLVFPEVLRAVLTQAILVQAADPEYEDGFWHGWFGFVSQFHQDECPNATDYESPEEYRKEVGEWIDLVVESFTRDRFPACQTYAQSRRQ